MTATPNIVDIDGNVYHTVTIGTQVWMVENLKTTRYNDGTAIPLVTDEYSMGNLTTPGYCWYNDSATYGNTYGALYNWYAVNTGKLAPTGWHVPTDSEWTVLTTYAGGESVAGGPLKEAGTVHWKSPNTGATNATGFTALPGGICENNGTFTGIGYSGYWWSSTPFDGVGYYIGMFSNYASIQNSIYVCQMVLSVRCVKGPPPARPATPSIGSVTVGDSSVTVTWGAVTGAITYNLYYAAGATVTTSGTKWAGATSPEQVTGLTNGTQYAFAVSAVNEGGESGLSNVVTATLNIFDIDGNVYHTVTIGTQVWMVENLKTTRYNDGAAIPLVYEQQQWGTLTTRGILLV